MFHSKHLQKIFPCVVASIVAINIVFTAPAVGQRDAGLKLLPDNDNAKRFKQFVDVVRQNNEGKWMEFVEKRMSAKLRQRLRKKDWLDQWKQMKTLWDQMNFQYVGTCNAKRVSLIGKRKNDPYEFWLEYLVEFDSDSPETIKDFDVTMTGPPRKLLDSKLTRQQTSKEFQRFLNRLEKKGLLSGTVLWGQHGKILHQRAAGKASLRYDVPNTLDTAFCMGSITKLFTAAAIMQLVEKGRLKLDDPIGKYLGEQWISKEVGKQVQVQHLLTHSGGVGDFFRHPEYANSNRAMFTNVNAFAKFIDVKAVSFQPGKKHVYSNSGFILLGKIIEEVTGKDYHEYMRANIYDPAEMKNTGCFFTNDPTKKIAQGYYLDRTSRKWVNNFLSQRVRGCPAGSSYSTVGDMFRFSQHLMGGKIVKDKTLRQMISPKPKLGSPRYGFGVQQFRQTLLVNAIGHMGGGPGVAACFAIYPETGHVLVVLTNQHRQSIFAIRQKVSELIAREIRDESERAK